MFPECLSATSQFLEVSIIIVFSLQMRKWSSEELNNLWPCSWWKLDQGSSLGLEHLMVSVLISVLHFFMVMAKKRLHIYAYIHIHIHTLGGRLLG